MASPPTSPTVPRQDVLITNSNDTTRARKPFGQVALSNNQTLATKPSLEKRKSRVLTDLTGVTGSKKGKGKENTAIQRVKEWEREKQRLREMQRLEELERERDSELEGKNEFDLDDSFVAISSGVQETLDALSSPEQSIPEVRVTATVHSSMGSFKHAIRSSIDKTVRKCTSTVSSAAPHGLSVDVQDDAESRRSHSERESWEDDALVREAKSSLPVVRHAIHNERMAAENQINRMTIWMKNVEKVVEDARQTFASSSSRQTPLPPLPLAPLSRSGSQSRSNRSSRLPRKILAANKIFVDDNGQSPTDQTMSSFVTSVCGSPAPEGESVEAETRRSPGQRRAAASVGPSDDIETNSPSKRKQESRSHRNLLQMRIKSATELEEMAISPPRRNLFIAPPAVPGEAEDSDNSVRVSKSFDELTASPHIVEPYPARTAVPVIPDTPNRIRLEGVYDRFLMATSGVKRVGKGYQSDSQGPVHNTVVLSNATNHNPRAFNSVRRPMPPPVASDDQRHSVSVDELGVMHSTPAFKDDGNTTVTMMRRALKALVPGKTVSRRLSRIAA